MCCTRVQDYVYVRGRWRDCHRLWSTSWRHWGRYTRRSLGFEAATRNEGDCWARTFLIVLHKSINNNTYMQLLFIHFYERFQPDHSWIFCLQEYERLFQ